METAAAVAVGMCMRTHDRPSRRLRAGGMCPMAALLALAWCNLQPLAFAQYIDSRYRVNTTNVTYPVPFAVCGYATINYKVGPVHCMQGSAWRKRRAAHGKKGGAGRRRQCMAQKAEHGTRGGAWWAGRCMMAM
eukprot:215787-Chlamydomonas_euryale.AAC.1